MEKYIFTFGYGGRAYIGKNLAQFEAPFLCLQVSSSRKFPKIMLLTTMVLPSSSELSILDRRTQISRGDLMTEG